MAHGRGEQIRAGSRGGRDQFEWDDVKVDKHRENYLGACWLVLIASASGAVRGSYTYK